MKRLTYLAAIAAMSMIAFACETQDPIDDGGDNKPTEDPTGKVEVTSVTLTADATTVEIGAMFQVTATVLPENATDKALSWKTSDDKVATVNSLGLVTAVAAGEAVISATAGECVGELKITVTEPAPVVGLAFSDKVVNYEKISEGVYVAELPIKEGYSFAGEFDMNGLFVNVPEGATFTLAPVDQQNSEVSEFYESLASNLASDGKWTRNERFTCDLNVGDNNAVNGIRILLSAEGEVKMQINFYIVDPVAGLERSDDNGHERLKISWMDQLVKWHGSFAALEMELGGSTNWQQMALKKGDGNDFNLALLFNDVTNFQDQGPYFNSADTEQALFTNWPNFSLSGTNGEEIFFNDTKNGKLALTGYGANLCKASRGIYWTLAWACYVNCANWQLPEEERPVPAIGAVAEIAALKGKENFVGAEEVEVFKELVGIYLTEDGHIKTTAAYEGAGARICPRLEFEYDYGYVCVSQRYLATIFLNRRWAAEGEVGDVELPLKYFNQ